jgi:hypothetical protein
MPYIKSEDRYKYREILEMIDDISLRRNILNSAGDLNYLITKIIHKYMAINGKKYQTMNDIVGALESAKAEFQRRVVSPYEDLKIDENGDL